MLQADAAMMALISNIYALPDGFYQAQRTHCASPRLR